MNYVKNLRGELYEKISGAKIFKDFYLEDFNSSSKRITSNCEINFVNFKNEMAPFLLIEPKNIYKESMIEINDIKYNF